MHPPFAFKSILILGLGNPLMGDDGIGIRVIEFLQKARPDVSCCADIIDGGTAGFDLLGVMCNRRSVVVVDAIKDDTQTAGTVCRVPAYTIASSPISAVSLHDVTLRDVFTALALVEECPLIDIVGIVVEHIGFAMTDEPSWYHPTIKHAAALVSDLVMQMYTDIPVMKEAR